MDYLKTENIRKTDQTSRLVDKQKDRQLKRNLELYFKIQMKER